MAKAGPVFLVSSILLLILGRRKEEEKKKAIYVVDTPPKDFPIPETPTMPAVPTDDFWKRLPESPGPEREGLIRQALSDNLGYAEWGFVESKGKGLLSGYTLKVPVTLDAVKIQGHRITANYNTGQWLADLWQAQMMTPYIANLIYNQANAQLTPTTSLAWVEDETMSKTFRSVEASKIVDKKLAEKIKEKNLKPPILVGNAGKYWVITNQFQRPGVNKKGIPFSQAAANYGLFRAPFQPIQNVGLAHSKEHVDYSQVLRYIGSHVLLINPDGTQQVLETCSVIKDKVLAPLLTGNEGALPYCRHPNIPSPVV